MSDYLMRETAPFGPEVWAKIDDMVVTVVKKALVARRFIPLVGPLGWGVELAPKFGFTVEEGAFVAQDKVDYTPLVELQKAFMLKAKHLAMAAQTPFGLDLGAVAIAATELAKAEDRLVILDGLAQAATIGELGDWSHVGGPFKAIAQAMAQMQTNGCDGPFAVVLGAIKYAELASLMQLGHGMRAMEMVEKLAKAGVFAYAQMPNDQVLVVSPQAWNLDLVVGQDVITSYTGNSGLDQSFRVFETLALRVKRPEAVMLLK